MGAYLSTPNKAKVSEEGDCPEFSFATSSMQGWRISMEDAHICQTDVVPGVHLFAVFDGHGGQEVARFCERKFVQVLKAREKFAEKRYAEALQEAFLEMDRLLENPASQKELQELKNDVDSALHSYAGCTANVCLITPEHIYCANAGDSRALLYDGKNVLHLSTDHKPDLEVEKRRITAAGGYVAAGRVNENLNLSRAIGDLEYKRNAALKPSEQIITAFPDVTETRRDPAHKFLLMGCDGIWEMLTPEQICTKINTSLAARPTKLASVLEELLDKLIAPDTSTCVGCDNMTSLLVVFKQAFA